MSFQIRDSYRIRSRAEMAAQIAAHRLIWPSNKALQRKTASLLREWCGHNLLYGFGIAQERTRSVDFDDDPKWYTEAVWFVLSLFYWH